MVVHSYYPADPRVRREAEALIDKGMQVDVIGLRQKGERRYEIVNGISVARLPVERHRGSGVLVYLLEYLFFFLLAFLKTTALFFQKRYKIIQIHTIPDFLVFCSLVPRFLGSSVILDMHEVMPEFFIYRYHLTPRHPLTYLVKWSEKLATAFAHHIITVSDTLKDMLVERDVPPDKITVIMNVADEKLFNQQDKQSSSQYFTLSYHGLVSDIYDLEVVFSALSLLRNRIPGLRFLVLGKGPDEIRYQKIAGQSGVKEMIDFRGYVPPEKIPDVFREVSVGLVPLKDNDFTHLAFPTKIPECIVMGVPVITARRRTIQKYFNENALAFYNADDADSLAGVISDLYQSPEKRKLLVKNARECYAEICWDKMKERYYRLIDKICI